MKCKNIRRRNITIAVLFFGLSIASVIAAREVSDRIAISELHSISNKLNGDFECVASWRTLFNREVIVTFRDFEFSGAEISQLTEAARQYRRGYVGVYFQNTNVTDDDAQKIRDAIHIGRVTFHNYRIAEVPPRSRSAG